MPANTELRLKRSQIHRITTNCQPVAYFLPGEKGRRWCFCDTRCRLCSCHLQHPRSDPTNYDIANFIIIITTRPSNLTYENVTKS